MSPSHHNRMFGHLRSALGAPSRASWDELCSILCEGARDFPDLLSQSFIPHAASHLTTWPDELPRVPPREWYRQALFESGLAGELLKLAHVTLAHFEVSGEAFYNWGAPGVIELEQGELMGSFRASEDPRDPMEPLADQAQLCLLASLLEHHHDLAPFMLEYVERHAHVDRPDQGPPQPWDVNWYHVAKYEEPWRYQLVALDCTWNVNGWPYGYWTVEVEDDLPTAIALGAPY